MKRLLIAITSGLLALSTAHAEDSYDIFSYLSHYLREQVFMKLYAEPVDHASIEFHSFFLENKYRKQFTEGRLRSRMQEVVVADRIFTLKVFECRTPGATEFHNCLYICGGCDDLHSADSKVDSFFHGYFSEKQPKNLRIFVFSYYETHLPDGERWMPADKRDMGVLPLHVTYELYKEGFHIDTLFWFSMGGMVCEGLPAVNMERDLSWLPSLFVSDRGLSSIWKVGQRLITGGSVYPLYSAIYSIAWGTNWHADPEQRLLEFFERLEGKPHKPTFLLFELSTDHYFSDETAFEPDFRDQVMARGATCYRGNFPMPDTPFHKRSHHNLPFHEIHVLPSADTEHFIPTKQGESLACSLIRFMLSSTR